MKRLFLNRDSKEIESIRTLIETQKHRTLVMWAIECSEPALSLFELRHPEDLRPRQAYDAAVLWSQGLIKMPEAKKAAHAAHNAAKELEDIDPIACACARVLGHLIGTIHVETHALGIVFYSVTASVYSNPQRPKSEVIHESIDWFYQKLIEWSEQIDRHRGPFAPFLLREDVPNKEYILHFKKKS